MNNTAKIVLGIVGGLIAMCLIAVVAGFLLIRSAGSVLTKTFESNLDKAGAIASAIADYTLPTGFESPYATRLAGFSMVTYTHTDGHSHVSFFQIPRGIHLDAAEMERQYRQTAPDKSGYRKDRIQVIDQVPGEINGQAVTLVISEGTNSDQQPFREVSAIFEGKGGQTLVVYEAPISRWDQAEVDAFLTSIH